MLVQGMCLDVMCLEKQQKPVQAGAQDPLSDLESGRAVPFSPQDFCCPCVFAVAATTQDPAGQDPPQTFRSAQGM